MTNNSVSSTSRQVNTMLTVYVLAIVTLAGIVIAWQIYCEPYTERGGKKVI